MAHAKLPPSGAKRWRRCTASPGYLLANAHKISRRDTAWSKEGTEAHEFAASALVNGYLESAIPNKDMARHVKGYVDLVESQITGDDQLQVEVRVPLFYSPTEYGTSDAVVLTDEALFITDLKYGEGVSVEARENEQLMIYAESVIQERKLRDTRPEEFDVVLTIFQPRAREGEPIREWRTTLGELRQFSERVVADAERIRKGDPEDLQFVVSDDTCQFCDARKFCDARAKALAEPLKVVGIDLLDVEEPGLPCPKPNTLTEQQVIAVAKIAMSGQIAKWFKDIIGLVEERVAANDPAYLSEFKLVEGKLGNRAWVNEEEVITLLRPKLGTDAIFTKELISPAQAEKLLEGKELSTRFENRFKELISRAPGKPSLVPTSDPRPPISLTAADVFGDDGL